MPGLDAMVDFRNPAQKAELWSYLRGIQGMHRVRVTVPRGLRSTQANGFYWAVVVKAFAEVLVTDGTADSYADAAEIAHEYFKRRFNSRAVAMVHRVTGEEQIARLVMSSAKLDKKQFYEYVERCRKWLQEALGIRTMDPGQYVPEQAPSMVSMAE